MRIFIDRLLIGAIAIALSIVFYAIALSIVFYAIDSTRVPQQCVEDYSLG